MSGDDAPDDAGVELDFFSPCPGCGETGFTIQVWHEGVQQMQCSNSDCRVSEYEPQVVER